MIYIDIELTPQPEIEGVGEVIQVIPSGKFSSSLSILDRIDLYKGDDRNLFLDFSLRLHKNIREWVFEIHKEFDFSAINFCTDHLAGHFSYQYCSVYSLALKLARNSEDYTILCRDTLLNIDGGWMSPVISFLAVLNAYSSVGKQISIAEVTPGILENIVRRGFKYLPSEVLYENVRNFPERRALFFSAIGESNNIRYSLTGRNQDSLVGVEGGILTVYPKSAIIGEGFVGIANQFGGVEGCSKDIAWQPMIDSLACDFSKKLESVFFESIYRSIIFPLVFLEGEFFELFGQRGSAPNLFVEETIDLEGLALLSALKRSGSVINVTQHSLNPVLSSLVSKFGEIEFFFPDRIIAGNKSASSIYKKYCMKNVSVVDNFSTESNMAPCTAIGGKRILIIENDFVRSFGVPYSLPELIGDLVAFLGAAKAFGFSAFLWRQRTVENTVVLEIIRILHPDIDIILDSSMDVPELSEMCFAAVGFGATSSLALKYITAGGIYFFGSSRIGSWEYLPSLDFLGEVIGPIFSARELWKCWSNPECFEMKRKSQTSSVCNEYGYNF